MANFFLIKFHPIYPSFCNTLLRCQQCSYLAVIIITWRLIIHLRRHQKQSFFEACLIEVHLLFLKTQHIFFVVTRPMIFGFMDCLKLTFCNRLLNRCLHKLCIQSPIKCNILQFCLFPIAPLTNPIRLSL